MNDIDITAIYDQLPELIKMENKGFVAGSFIAAQIFRQLGVNNINHIANDLDWFIDHTNIIDSKNFCGVDLSGFEKAIVQTIDFDTRVFDLDYSQLTWEDLNEYKVIASRRLDDDINIISVNFVTGTWNILIPQLETLVSAFDINAIQVGFDVSAKRLYGTDQFWKFCKTLQLEITNLFTPSHSMIRYLKKKRELGCYGDDEFNKNIVLAGLGQHPMNAKFGKITHEKALVEFEQLTRLGFKIATYTAKSGYKYYRLEGKDSTKILTDLYSVFGGEIISVGQSNLLSFRDGASSQYFPDFHPKQLWKVSNLVWRGSIKEKNFMRDFFQNMERNDKKNTFRAIVGRVDFVIGQKHRHFKMVNRIHKFKEEHPSLMFWAGVITKNADDLVFVDNFFNSVRNKYGASGIGIIENRDFLTEMMPTLDELKSGNFERAYSNIDAQFTEVNEPLNEKIIQSVDVGEFQIEELNTQGELFEEGAFQRHCVGGYAQSIKQGNCRILSIRSSTRPRITLEIREAPEVEIEGHVCFKAFQSKIKFNGAPDLEWLKLAIDGINSNVPNFKLLHYSLLTEEERKLYYHYNQAHQRLQIDGGDDFDINDDEIPF